MEKKERIEIILEMLDKADKRQVILLQYFIREFLKASNH